MALLPPRIDMVLHLRPFIRRHVLAWGPTQEPAERGLAGVRDVIRQLGGDDRGQDLIEYGLLTALIGVASIAAWAAIEAALGNAYGAYDAGIQGAWEPPNPGGGS